VLATSQAHSSRAVAGGGVVENGTYNSGWLQHPKQGSKFKNSIKEETAPLGLNHSGLTTLGTRMSGRSNPLNNDSSMNISQQSAIALHNNREKKVINGNHNSLTVLNYMK